MSLPKELVKEIREAVESGAEVVILSNCQEKKAEVDKLIESIKKETGAKSNKEEGEDILLSVKNELEDAIDNLRIHIKIMKCVHRLLCTDIETPTGVPNQSERIDSIQKAQEKLKSLEQDLEMIRSIEKILETSK